jgi:hypothetical protein
MADIKAECAKTLWNGMVDFQKRECIVMNGTNSPKEAYKKKDGKEEEYY